MNTTGHDMAGADAREWVAQERARGEAGDDAPPGDARDEAYRRVARALRQPPPVDLPPGFAGTVAHAARARTAETNAAARAFERRLRAAAFAAFAAFAVPAGVVYGTRLFAQLQDAIGASGVRWSALLAACLGASWVLDRLARQMGHKPDAAARTAR
jgi:hypothetical protein